MKKTFFIFTAFLLYAHAYGMKKSQQTQTPFSSNEIGQEDLNTKLAFIRAIRLANLVGLSNVYFLASIAAAHGTPAQEIDNLITKVLKENEKTDKLLNLYEQAIREKKFTLNIVD